MSVIEATNISPHGFWLLSRAGELFLPFDEFPWFRDAPVAHMVKVEEPMPGHFYWPELDVDLSEAIIRDPSAYPLRAR